MDRTKMLVTYFKLSEKERQERFLAKTSEDLLKKKLFALGSAHLVILNEDGTVTAFGDNRFGQCGVEEWSDVVKLAAGDFHTVALKKDGTALAVGDNTYGQCAVEGWEGLTDIFARSSLTVGVKQDGSLLVASQPPKAEEKPDATEQLRGMLAEMGEALGKKIDEAMRQSAVQPISQGQLQGEAVSPRQSFSPFGSTESTAVADSPSVNETPAGNFLYSITDGAVTISSYTGAGGDVVIPRRILGRPVAVIADRAFEKQTKIRRMTISDTVTQIHAYAFKGCTKMTEVVIPANASLNRISECAFEGCTSLKKLVLPESLHTIGRWAFTQCTSLESVILPNSISTVGFGAFSECTNLKNVYITEKAQSMLGRLDLILDNLNVVRTLPPPRGL